MKKMLSVVLAMVLALVLFVPAFAAEQTQVSPNAPIITQQPRTFFNVRPGDSVDLNIAAELPPDAEGELSIVWFRVFADRSFPFAHGATATYTTPAWDLTYSVEIYAVVTNTDGDGQTASVRSLTVRITAMARTWDFVREVWTYNFVYYPWWQWPIRFMIALFFTVVFVPVSMFINTLGIFANAFDWLYNRII
ncbi:MAG: hypothetical protein FWE40_02225 [Oscillospiraceae bacterium]|jgi:putative cell wall-binding protein|nr:hypothetical protein [Oscillospiraceae bacterium]